MEGCKSPRTLSSDVALSLLVAGLVAVVGACTVNIGGGPAPTNAMAKRGPETWEVGGRTYRIESTYFLTMPGRGLQYTISYECLECPVTPNKLTESQALSIAEPLMRYAVQSGKYTRTKVTLNGTPVEASLVGVELFQKRGMLREGFRVQRTVAAFAGSPP